MSFLKQVLEDMGGATSVSSVAGARGSLFNSPMKREINPTKIDYIKVNQDLPGVKKIKSKSKRRIHEEEEFNSLDVVSKLNFAEKNVDRDTKSTVFGLQDKNGDTVKVYVQAEQGKAFEEALHRELKRENHRDVAEILFELRNKFDILFVEWPQLPEDEEVDMNLQGDENNPGAGDPNAEGDINLDDLENGPEGDDAGKEEEPELEPPVEDDTSSLKGMLDKIIDMLKSDAEAKTADANARSKEAQAKEAEAAAKIADAKIKSTEEVLGAENFFKQQQSQKKEAQKLVKLAAYRQAISQQQYVDDLDQESGDHY